MNIDELYDPIEQASLARFEEPGDTYSGIQVKVEFVDDKYAGRIPAITWKLDKPTVDGEDYTLLLARSAQMQRELAKAAKRAGTTELSVGDWSKVTYVESHESASGGNDWKEYAVGYELASEFNAEPPDDAAGPLGTATVVDTDGDAVGF